MNTQAQQTVTLPIDTVRRLEELMSLSRSIIQKVSDAPPEKRGEVLGRASLELNRGWREIWSKSRQFREDHKILKGALEVGGGGCLY